MSGIVDMLAGGSGSNNGGTAANIGISLAKITNIKDPKNLGRVKCSYITSDKDAGETGWIYCLTPFGGNKYGSFFHANVGDIVALAYENGDIHRPFVIGSLWVKDAKPPITVKDGENKDYRFTTPNNSVVDFFDEKGKEKITVSTPKKRTVVIDDEKQLLELDDGKNKLTMNGKDGSVEINCNKKLTIKVGSGVTITCDGTGGSLNIKTNKEIKLSTAQFNAKASGTAEVSANGSLTVKSSGVTTIKGSMTKIN
ncbi:MAG: phage baseplate assembly protein V [Oscillospiraceae bacterium]